MSCAHLCKQGVATLAQADWANAEHCPAGLGLDLRAAGPVARGFVRRLAVERWRCPRRSGHLCEVPRGSREGPAGGMWGGVAGWGSRDVLIKLFWPGGPQVVAHHGIHGNAPMLDPAFACGDNLARQSLGLWRQRPGRQLGADHAEWGEGSSTCAWAEAREDQKGVLGRHRRPGGLGCHRRRSLTAHRWRGSRHATRGSPGGGDFVHMAAPLGLRGGGVAGRIAGRISGRSLRRCLSIGGAGLAG